MSMNILLPMASYPDKTPSAGLLRAFDVASTLGAVVTPIVHEVDIPEVRSLLGNMIIDVPQMIAVAEQRSSAHADELIDTVRAVARRFELAVEPRRWRGTLDLARAYLAKLARAFDHTFLVPCEGSGQDVDVAEAILFGSGGPVWIFPAGETTGHLQSVAVAWDGGRAAARALRDALPVLGQTTHVTILCATDDKPIDEVLLSELRRLLEEHGLENSTRLFSRGSEPIGNALQEVAVEAGAGLLIMGGYGHNRMREFVLGGATRSVLAVRKLPILMSH